MEEADSIITLIQERLKKKKKSLNKTHETAPVQLASIVSEILTTGNAKRIYNYNYTPSSYNLSPVKYKRNFSVLRKNQIEQLPSIPDDYLSEKVNIKSGNRTNTKL